jgi:hypothetical protein
MDREQRRRPGAAGEILRALISGRRTSPPRRSRVRDPAPGYLIQEGITSVGQIRHDHIEGFVEHLLDKRSAATASLRFRVPQQFFRWLASCVA